MLFNTNNIIKYLIKLFPNFTMKYRKYRENKYKKLTPVRTKNGFLFTGNPAMMDGSFEPTETKIIDALLLNSNYFINIGANIGYYSCLALQRGVKTIAFEPINSNLEIFKKNLRINNFLDKIELYSKALSNIQGTKEIFGIGTSASFIKGWASNTETISEIVEIDTLDNCLSNRFSSEQLLILIDVEGYEYNVLRGGIQTIKKDKKPFWFIEISFFEHMPKEIKKNPNFVNIFELFWSNGYKSYLANKTLDEINKEIILHAFTEKKDILHSHNFLFIDKEIDLNNIIRI